MKQFYDGTAWPGSLKFVPGGNVDEWTAPTPCVLAPPDRGKAHDFAEASVPILFCRQCGVTQPLDVPRQSIEEDAK